MGVNSESAIHNQNVQPLGAVARAESATSLRAATDAGTGPGAALLNSGALDQFAAAAASVLRGESAAGRARWVEQGGPPHLALQEAIFGLPPRTNTPQATETDIDRRMSSMSMDSPSLRIEAANAGGLGQGVGGGGGVGMGRRVGAAVRPVAASLGKAAATGAGEGAKASKLALRRAAGSSRTCGGASGAGGGGGGGGRPRGLEEYMSDVEVDIFDFGHRANQALTMALDRATGRLMLYAREAPHALVQTSSVLDGQVSVLTHDHRVRLLHRDGHRLVDVLVEHAFQAELLAHHARAVRDWHLGAPSHTPQPPPQTPAQSTGGAEVAEGFAFKFDVKGAVGGKGGGGATRATRTKRPRPPAGPGPVTTQRPSSSPRAGPQGPQAVPSPRPTPTPTAPEEENIGQYRCTARLAGQDVVGVLRINDARFLFVPATRDVHGEVAKGHSVMFAQVSRTETRKADESVVVKLKVTGSPDWVFGGFEAVGYRTVHRQLEAQWAESTAFG